MQMGKFLNTSAANYYLEELIKNARDRLILISPYLKLNSRIKELIEDKNRLKIDIRIVYGKSEMRAEEFNWLKSLAFVRTSFCKNLHAKCYINEDTCIITSLNLYEFSQINNNEMGIAVSRHGDPDIYQEAYEEAQRIIRISDDTNQTSTSTVTQNDVEQPESPDTESKLTSSKLAKKLGIKNTSELLTRLTDKGYLKTVDGKQTLTETGEAAGGEMKLSKRFGPYFIWPKDLEPE